MPAQWTADVIGEMHLNGITQKMLAEEVGWNPKYLSAILNGHVETKVAESKLRLALDRLVCGQGNNATESVPKTGQ